MNENAHFIHVGFGSSLRKGIEEGLQVHGENIRQSHALQVIGDMPAENFQLVIGGSLDGAQLVGLKPQGKPLTKGHIITCLLFV